MLEEFMPKQKSIWKNPIESLKKDYKSLELEKLVLIF